MGDRAVHADCIACKAFRVLPGQAGKIAYQHSVCLRIRLYLGAVIGPRPLVCNSLDDRRTLVFVRKCQLHTRRPRLQLGRQLDSVADQDDLAADFGLLQANVLQQADVQRVVQEWVKIEQHVDARLGDCADVAEHVRRIGVQFLRLERQVLPLQTIGDRPAEYGQMASRRPHGGRQEHLQDAAFVPGFDDDDGCAGPQDQVEVVVLRHLLFQTGRLLRPVTTWQVPLVQGLRVLVDELARRLAQRVQRELSVGLQHGRQHVVEIVLVVRLIVDFFIQ